MSAKEVTCNLSVQCMWQTIKSGQGIDNSCICV